MAALRIVIGSDDAGFDYKEIVKRDLVASVTDVGVDATGHTHYPLVAIAAAEMVAKGEADRAILNAPTTRDKAPSPGPGPPPKAASPKPKASCPPCRQHCRASPRPQGRPSPPASTGRATPSAPRPWPPSLNGYVPTRPSTETTTAKQRTTAPWPPSAATSCRYAR
jgi:hypothetical protein